MPQLRLSCTNDLSLDFNLGVGFDFTAPEPPVYASRPEDSSPGSPVEVDIRDVWLEYANFYIPLPRRLQRQITHEVEDVVYSEVLDDYNNQQEADG